MDVNRLCGTPLSAKLPAAKATGLFVAASAYSQAAMPPVARVK
jgi:hypothetical protein